MRKTKRNTSSEITATRNFQGRFTRFFKNAIISSKSPRTHRPEGRKDRNPAIGASENVEGQLEAQLVLGWSKLK
jgi:hypothetical protein